MLYVTHESSFVSTQFFIFNLDRWLSDNISYYHIIFRSSVVSFLFLVDIYLPLDIYLSNPIFSASVSIVYKLFCGGVLETYVIMSAILLPIKSPVTSAVFFNFSFWSSFSCFCYRLFSLIKKFLAVFTAHFFTYIFVNIVSHIYGKRQKSIPFYKYSLLVELKNESFLCFTLDLIITVMFI